jgi:hypothetical protein
MVANRKAASMITKNKPHISLTADIDRILLGNPLVDNADVVPQGMDHEVRREVDDSYEAVGDTCDFSQQEQMADSRLKIRVIFLNKSKWLTIPMRRLKVLVIFQGS